MTRLATLFFLLSLIGGCATTKMQTHVDKEHRGKIYSKIVVDAPNANFEFKQLLTSELCSSLREKSVECVAKYELFPPTRQYSDKQIDILVNKSGIDGWLIVSLGGGGTNQQYLGSQTFGSATVYGNTVSGSASSMAVYSFNRQQGYTVIMFDMDSKLRSFIMEASTSASGLLNIKNSVFAESLVKKIMSEMTEAGFINQKIQ